MITLQMLTSVEKSYSYSKYCFRDLPPFSKQQKEAMDHPLEEHQMLSIQHRERLLSGEDLPADIGYGIFHDGTGYVSNTTPMKGVTPEIFYWWFAWHALEDLRYRLALPEEHFYARSQNADQNLDESLPMCERIWDTTHVICENIVTGAEEIVLDYLSPKKMGFDETRLGTNYAMVCANGHTRFSGLGLDCVTVHTLMTADSNVSVRTQHWIGYQILNGKVEKILDDNASISMDTAKSMFQHCANEFNNLATFLPQLYTEEV